MSHITLSISIEPRILEALNVPEQALAREIRAMAAARFYDQGRLTLGQAASLAGMLRADFIQYLSDEGVAVIQTTFDEVLEDGRTLARLRGGGIEDHS